MEVTFSVRGDLQVDAHLGKEWPVFDDALGDSISSLPPRGATGNGPSLYWIDKAEEGAVKAHQAGDTRPFLRGNSTFLRVVGERVVAKYDYDEDDEPGEALPLEDFLAILAAWRSQVQASTASATEPLPDTYGRNPAELALGAEGPPTHLERCPGTAPTARLGGRRPVTG